MPNTRVDYIHPKQVTYGRLIRSLKSGFAIQQTLVIKDFKCHCSDHENTLKRAIVVEGINKLKRRICSFVAVADHGIAIDAEGQICIDGYCFYSTHPNWQVRAAVAFGLAKIKSEGAMAIAAELMNDSHYGVKLAVVQSLERMKTDDALNLLQNLAANNNERRIKTMAMRALERHKFGINSDKRIHTVLEKLQTQNLIRKKFQRSERNGKVYIPRVIFDHHLNNNKFAKYCDGQKNQTNYGIQTLSIIRPDKSIVPVKLTRNTKEKTRQHKLSYTNSLFFQNNVLIKEINNNCNPIKGEVYWAITSATDPKLTRPVLIIKAMNEKAGDFLVVSLTSDVPAHVNNNMIVKIGEERSRIQPSFHQVIHKSMLLNKCAEVPENVVQRIKKIVKQLKNLEEEKRKKTKETPQQIHPHKPRKRYSELNKPRSETYFVTDIPAVKPTEVPKVKGSKHKNTITLYDFFKPKDRLILEQKTDKPEKKVAIARK